MDNINVTVDTNILQEKAKEFAMKGALKAIEDYYTGYDSPFKKGIIENLQQNRVDTYSFCLPDILSLINESLTAEIDKIANTVVAQTFVPLVAKFLTRQEKEANFSDILKQFVETARYDEKYMDDFSVYVDKDDKYSWLNVEINDAKRTYKFTLHEEYNSKKTSNIKYQLLSLPTTEKTEGAMMRVDINGHSLQLPFVRNILQDNFVSYLAGYLISNTVITIDTREFEEYMFPEPCHCH